MLNVMMIGRRVEIKVVRYFIIPLEDKIRLSSIPNVSSYRHENTPPPQAAVSVYA